MARAGRKPKSGARHECGKLVQPTEPRRIGPTPEHERKKREALGDLAAHAEEADYPARLCSSGWITHEMWRAASRYRGLCIKAYGRIDAKPGALAALLPDPDRGYKTDSEAEHDYRFLRDYVVRWGARDYERQLYQLAVLRQPPARLNFAIRGLKLLIEGQTELAKRRERGDFSEMQAAELGPQGAAA